MPPMALQGQSEVMASCAANISFGYNFEFFFSQLVLKKQKTCNVFQSSSNINLVEIWENKKCCYLWKHEPIVECLQFLSSSNFYKCYYVTNRLWAQDFYLVIVNLGAAWVNYHMAEIKSKSNCCDIKLLVVQNFI